MRSTSPRFPSLHALAFGLVAAGAVIGACALQSPERTTGPQTTPSLSATPTPTDPNRGYFEFQVEHPATIVPGSKVPTYPPELRSASVEGEVVASFVVGTDGRADLMTFKVIKSTNDQFTQSVRTALAGYRWTPATVGGHAVKQLVQLPFVFKLSGS